MLSCDRSHSDALLEIAEGEWFWVRNCFFEHPTEYLELLRRISVSSMLAEARMLLEYFCKYPGDSRISTRSSCLLCHLWANCRLVLEQQHSSDALYIEQRGRKSKYTPGRACPATRGRTVGLCSSDSDEQRGRMSTRLFFLLSSRGGTVASARARSHGLYIEQRGNVFPIPRVMKESAQAKSRPRRFLP